MDKISLAGDLGSGKSTVAKILIEALGAEYYSTGSIVRAIAEKKGMTIGELNVYMETHPEIDREVDDGLIALASDPRSLIIDSRMAWHFTEGTFKVYLSTDTETSAIRIMSANRSCEHASTLEETIACTRARRESEKKRYSEKYGVDITDLTNYSLVVDTTGATPEEVAGVIISSFEKWRENREATFCYLSPERLNYIDDEHDAELLRDLSARLERGEDIPEITVFEKDGEFYLDSGTESALAYAFNLYTYLPVRLVKGEQGERKYVKMKNSL
ncbi:MAG: AAA family ATPase [Clostridia bacterium]|nr:AAA family ATPase [Clostridia bacterium]